MEKNRLIIDLCKRVIDGELKEGWDLFDNCEGISCELDNCPFGIKEDEQCVLHIPEERIEIAKKYLGYTSNRATMEKSFQEVIATIKEREIWICPEINRAIIKDDDGIIRVKHMDNTEMNNVTALVFGDERYILERKRYSFEEALRAYKKGREIESYVTGDKYHWNGVTDTICKNGTEDYCKLKSIDIEEIKGEWYIND